MAEISQYQRKKQKEEVVQEVDKDAWMVTFGDLLQLLITFFVLMISMSSMDQKVFKEMFSFFGGGMGVLGFTEKTQLMPTGIKPMLSAPRFDTKAFKEFLEEESKKTPGAVEIPKDVDELLNSLLVNGVEIVRKGKNYSMIFSQEAAFPPGGIKISTSLKPILDWIASVLIYSKNKIIVQGHTDDQPYKSLVMPTNWELSAARASAVFIYLVNEGKLQVERIEAKGFSSHRPRIGNISDAYRKHNRRIEIVIKQFTEENI